jgi:hypothetical protein
MATRGRSVGPARSVALEPLGRLEAVRGESALMKLGEGPLVQTSLSEMAS